MASININTTNMVSQFLSVNSGIKKSSVSGSFNITANIPTPTLPSFGIAPGNSGAYKLDSMYYNDGTRKNYGSKLPAFTGLTKSEPSISEEELRETIIKLAKDASASGKDYAETAKQVNALVDKFICGVSPDRAGVASKGNISLPSNCNSFFSKMVGEDNNQDCIASYQTDQGWSTYLTETEIKAAKPFGNLFYNVFYGLDDGSGGSKGSSVDFKA